MELIPALELKDGEVVSIVGAGGKTNLMYALAAELVRAGRTVLTTTTTRIAHPGPDDTPRLMVEPDPERALAAVRDQIEEFRHITLASQGLDSSRLRGITPEAVVALSGVKQISNVLVESDGASLKPMKVPNATEPVTPENAAVVVAVMGLDALGQPLETHVFRYQLAAVLLGVTPETPLTLEMAALMLTHPSGVAQYSPPAARIIPFLNKADRLPDPAPARALARRILSRRHPQIARVLIGQVQAAPPVIEVVTDV